MAGGVGRAHRHKLKAEINVTPLVDVVLVLLIVFLVVTPLIARGKDVPLPLAAVEQGREQGPKPLVISVTADRRVWLGMDQVSRERLVQQVGRLLQAQPERELLLKADRSMQVADLRPLLVELERAGARRIALAVESAGGGARP